MVKEGLSTKTKRGTAGSKSLQRTKPVLVSRSAIVMWTHSEETTKGENGEEKRK